MAEAGAFGLAGFFRYTGIAAGAFPVCATAAIGRQMTVPFSSFDLNLLRVFDAVMEERSVLRASQKVFLSQSGVSHSLARLREMLDAAPDAEPAELPNGFRMNDDGLFYDPPRSEGRRTMRGFSASPAAGLFPFRLATMAVRMGRRISRWASLLRGRLA